MSFQPDESLIGSITKIPLFKGLTHAQVRKLLAISARRICQPTDQICGEDTPSDEMYILASGRLSVNRADGIRITTIEPVATVGEMGVVVDLQRSAIVQAMESSQVLTIPKAQFDMLLEDNVDIQVAVYRNIIEMLASKILHDNVRSRDHVVERIRYENLLKEHQAIAQGALDMLVNEAGMSSQEAERLIADLQKDAFLRVLVVDDEPSFLRFAREALTAVEVMEATDGLDALDVVQSQQPDLVVTDIKMPKMDGVELLGELRRQYPDLPVLAISGYMDADTMEGHGFDGFVRKPVRVEQFRHVVEETLASPKKAEEA